MPNFIGTGKDQYEAACNLLAKAMIDEMLEAKVIPPEAKWTANTASIGDPEFVYEWLECNTDELCETIAKQIALIIQQKVKHRRK